MDKWELLDEKMLDKWDEEEEGGEGDDVGYEDFNYETEDEWIKAWVEEDED